MWSTWSAVPCTTASTVPSGRFCTHPVTPSMWARRTAAWR
ncbi:Uncharacterised protein [Bordetella pertussis]|nr:Uncharacterised protein [Bordetella pertussis]CFW03290.1 Uncharacterised protein [Bordetella pertussis]CFW33450.1 Uncharacterised protein [Bordetella pertussis]